MCDYFQYFSGLQRQANVVRHEKCCGSMGYLGIFFSFWINIYVERLFASGQWLAQYQGMFLQLAQKPPKKTKQKSSAKVRLCTFCGIITSTHNLQPLNVLWHTNILSPPQTRRVLAVTYCWHPPLAAGIGDNSDPGHFTT